MIQALISPLASLAGTWLEGTVEKTKAEAGAIKFSDKNQMNSYFNEYCVSYDELQQGQNNLFTFLFFLLLFIFIVTIVCQMMGKSKKAAVTSFGRFSF